MSGTFRECNWLICCCLKNWCLWRLSLPSILVLCFDRNKFGYSTGPISRYCSNWQRPFLIGLSVYCWTSLKRSICWPLKNGHHLWPWFDFSSIELISNCGCCEKLLRANLGFDSWTDQYQVNFWYHEKAHLVQTSVCSV